MKNITFHNRSPRLLIISAAVAAGVVALTGCTGAPAPIPTSTSATQPPITPRLSGADNFRDLGGIGAGYRTAGGGHVARGVVYRSNALTLTPADLASLSSLHITEVVDLRTSAEIAAKPDTPLPGAEWINQDVLGSTDVTTAPSFATPQEAVSMMDGVYTSMVTSPEAREAIAGTLTTIADAKGAVVVHCTAGKDRTGWTSALLLHIAGADRETIDQNYLLSNQYSRAAITASLGGITAAHGAAAAAAYAPLLGVEQPFLDAAYAAAEQQYGSVDGYLANGLGLSTATIAKLKARLTA
jgi:protein-tyrosine phosphatase